MRAACRLVTGRKNKAMDTKNPTQPDKVTPAELRAAFQALNERLDGIDEDLALLREGLAAAARQPAAAPAPTAEPAQEPAAAPPPPDAAFQGVMVVIGAVLQQIDLTLRSHFAHFAAGDEGYSGEDFAAYFCDQQIGLPSPWNLMAPDGISGAEALIRIRQFSATDNQGNIVPAPEAGRRIILESYQHNPATWQALCPTEERAKLFDQFIAEFLNYDPEGEAEPAAPPAKGARK